MDFISSTEMGEYFGLSYQKVNKVLAEKNLYNKETRRPTVYAIENGLAEMKTTVSRFTGKTVDFNVWDFSKLKMIFPKPLKQASVIRCRNSEDAFDKICHAFFDFGIMLKIDQDKPKKGISKEAQNAVIQSYYCDPHFFHGFTLLHRFFNPEEAETAKVITVTLATELFIAAKKINAARAQSNLRVIETVMQWLCDKAHY